MAKCSTCASRRSSTRGETCKRQRWARRWLDESRPPKKGGADPALRLRSPERKPRAQAALPRDGGRQGLVHAALLEVHLRQRRLLCGGRAVGSRRQAFDDDGAEAL